MTFRGRHHGGGGGQALLVLLAVLALLAFTAALVLPLVFPAVPVVLHIHLALAAGAMPLIIVAVSYFVPVLTRSRAAPAGIASLGLVAAIAGFLAVGLFIHADTRDLYVPATAMLGVAGVMVAWMWRRAQCALGAPHPCFYWYVAALACLMLALLAVVAMSVWPDQRPALRLVHLHLNLIGFVGLTAIGTLQVLLPTVAGRFDPDVTIRMRWGLPFSVVGTLLIAGGAAWLPWLAWGGVALWLVVLIPIASSWIRLYRREILSWHGAAPSLAAAFVGFSCVIAGGGVHVLGVASPATIGHLYVFAFLLPLVSGAVSHLLPLWLSAKRSPAWRKEAQRRLNAGGGLRGFLFLAAGVLTAVGWHGSFSLALGGMFLVFAVLLWLLWIPAAAGTRA